MKVLELDGRARTYKIIREVRDSLLSACPQPPTPTMYMLCERAAVLQAHLVLADKAVLAGDGTPSRNYLAMSNAHARVLRQLHSLRSGGAPAHSGDSLVSRLADAAAERAA